MIDRCNFLFVKSCDVVASHALMRRGAWFTLAQVIVFPAFLRIVSSRVVACSTTPSLSPTYQVDHIILIHPISAQLRQLVTVCKMAVQTSNDATASSTHHEIRQLTNSDDDVKKAWHLWQAIFPDWPISDDRFKNLLFGLRRYHWIHEHGFCLSCTVDETRSSSDGAHGRIAVIGVLPEHRRQGIGSALLEQAKNGLKDVARASGKELKSLEMGSIFPRFWWQIPSTVPQETKDFFSHRGICLESLPIDSY